MDITIICVLIWLFSSIIAGLIAGTIYNSGNYWDWEMNRAMIIIILPVFNSIYIIAQIINYREVVYKWIKDFCKVLIGI